ncbi:MAG: FAD-binding oxidoreductase [Acidobacteriota bacterium]|nr:FAD-binding oxidoreductase [Acidobacteriota bacterium]
MSDVPPPSADAVVVGGGLVGASVAYELALGGLEVVLVDAGTPGRASDAGAGIASPQTFHEPDEGWYRFGAAAASHLRRLVARLAEDGVAVEARAFAECGALVLALAEHEDPWFEEQRRLAVGRDPEVTEITPEEARAMFPPLRRPWRALHSPRSARVDGRLLTAGLRDAAARRGARLVADAVSAIDAAGPGGRAVTTVTGARVACDTVVLAAGAWSGALPAGRAPLPVAPTKGEIVHLAVADPAAGTGSWPIVQPVLNFYLVPWPGGRVACGGTFHPDAGFDVRPTAGGIRDLLRECTAIAPGLAEAAVVETRVGLRPTSPDGRPLLGAVTELPGVHACTGHGADGLLLGPYSAALVAAGILGGEAPPELAPFSPSRLR